MIGWRKLTAWLLVYILVGASMWMQRDVPANSKEIIIWATGFFFGANAIKPLMQGVSVNIGGAKQ